METKEIKVYKITELEPKIREKVVNKWMDDNSDWIHSEVTDHLIEFLGDRGVDITDRSSLQLRWSLFSQGSGARFEFWYNVRELFLCDTPIIPLSKESRDYIETMYSETGMIGYKAHDIRNRYAYHDVKDVIIVQELYANSKEENSKYFEGYILQIVRDWYDSLCKALYKEAHTCYSSFTSEDYIINEINENGRLFLSNGTEVTHLINEE